MVVIEKASHVLKNEAKIIQTATIVKFGVLRFFNHCDWIGHNSPVRIKTKCL